MLVLDFVSLQSSFVDDSIEDTCYEGGIPNNLRLIRSGQVHCPYYFAPLTFTAGDAISPRRRCAMPESLPNASRAESAPLVLLHDILITR